MLETEPIELVGTLNVGQVGTRDYEKLTNKPVINDIQLTGNLSSADLGLQPAGSYIINETDPVFSASASAGITSQDITNWNNKSDFSGNYNDLSNKPTIPTKTSDLNNDSGFINKNVDDLTNYYDKTTVDSKVSSVYKYKGTVATYQDLPSSGLTIGDVYNVASDGSNYAWTGTVWDKLGGDIDLSGYQTKIDSSHKLSADLIDDTSTTNKLTNATEKTAWNAKYDKPSDGIPSTDLSSAVQTSLGKADTALQTHQDISGKENITNKVTSISSNSTDIEYPSAKCVYDALASAGGGNAFYLGNVGDYTQQNPLDLDKLEVGLYCFNSFSETYKDLYITGTNDGLTYTGSVNISPTAGNEPDIIYFQVKEKFDEMTLSSANKYYAVIKITNYRSNKGELNAQYNNLIFVKNNGVISMSTSTSTTKLLNGNNTAWSPSTDYSPASKKYVDDLVGDISTILESLVTVSGGE